MWHTYLKIHTSRWYIRLKEHRLKNWCAFWGSYPCLKSGHVMLWHDCTILLRRKHFIKMRLSTSKERKVINYILYMRANSSKWSSKVFINQRTSIMVHILVQSMSGRKRTWIMMNDFLTSAKSHIQESLLLMKARWWVMRTYSAVNTIPRQSNARHV